MKQNDKKRSDENEKNQNDKNRGDKVKKTEREKAGQKSAGGRAAKILLKPVRYVFIKIVGVAVIVCALAAGAYFGWQKFTQVRLERTHAMIEKQLLLCQELVTAKTRYSDIVSIKKSGALGLARSYSIVKFSGVVRAGLADISKARFTVSRDRKSVTVNLPRSEILGNEIAAQEVFDERRSIFVPISVQEIFDGIEEARTAASESLVAQGVLDDADRQAALAVRTMLQGLGFENITVR